ncbi:MAG: peptidoglycan DD-metalloendopeptidase family protein [Bradymonadia bacterium]
MSRRLIVALMMCVASTAHGQAFEYNPPGQLHPGSGQGRVDEQVYVPGMRFPIEEAPAFANSQVWGRGGSQGGGGGQCDGQNYSYPWSDNFCESRQWNMPLCPSGNGHQGQDIRPATCEDQRWWAVAAEDGRITNIGSYSVYLDSDSGTLHRYLHMDPGSLRVREGQRVSQGDRLGLVSNAFGGTPTTIHLHYDLNQNVAGVGQVYVPTYMSLVRSYERLIGMPAEPCAIIPAAGGTLDNDSRCFDRFGPPATWRLAEGPGEGGSLLWTFAWTNDTPGNWARWRIEMAQGGRFEIQARLEAAYASSQQALYRVRHSGRETPVQVNLANAGQWLSLGTFDLAQGGDQWVAVYDNTGEDRDLERRIMADAIRIVPERVMMPDADVPPPPPVDAGVVDDPDAFFDNRPDAFVDNRPDMGMAQPDRDLGVSPDRDAYVNPFDPAFDTDAAKLPDPEPVNQDATRSVKLTGGCSASGHSPSAVLWCLVLGISLFRRRRS